MLACSPKGNAFDQIFPEIGLDGSGVYQAMGALRFSAERMFDSALSRDLFGMVRWREALLLVVGRVKA